MHWMKVVVLAVILFGSTWTTFTYLQIKTSPIAFVSEWVLAVEQRNILALQRYSVWNGREIDKMQAERLVEALHRHPEWKQRIYEQLQKEAVNIVGKNTHNVSYNWFKLILDKGSLTYKVDIPSIYFIVDSDLQNVLLKVNDHFYSSDSYTYGPFMAIDTDIAIVYQNSIDDIIENVTITLPEMWGEQEIHILPSSTFVSFKVISNIVNGDLFIDGNYAGEIQGSASIGPLSYEEHVVQLEKTLPWGTVYSEPIHVPKEATTVYVPLDLKTSTLIEQLGDCLVRFNESWVDAMQANDISKLNYVSEALRSLMTEWLMEQNGRTIFQGHFVQVLIDPQSIAIRETSGQKYEATVVVREDYIDAEWLDVEGGQHSTYDSQRYWKYYLSYVPVNGWQVVDLVPIASREVGKRDWTPYHSQRVLRIGIDAGLVPFGWIRNGKLVGLDVEVMRWLEEKLGIKVAFYEMPWNQIRTQFGISGKLDGAISAIDEETAKTIPDSISSIPYYNDLGNVERRYVIVLRSDLQHLLSDINHWIRQLHENYEADFNIMLQKYNLEN